MMVKDLSSNGLRHAKSLSVTFPRADPSLPDTPIVHASGDFCELTGLYHESASFTARM